MKKPNILFSLIVLFIFSVSNITGQDIKYKNIRTAEGTINWKLEDKDGNILKEGNVVNGEWRQSGGMLIDYLVLEKSGKDEIETALIFLGEKRCPMLSMSMQVYFNGTFYPGKNYRQRYTLKPNDWADSGTRFGMGNSQIMIFNGSGASCNYRAMQGCFINQIVIPNEESFIEIKIDDKYTFYLLGGTDYKWEK